ncbi:MAG: serine protease [Alphaproteobacteria bacterium]|nr:serine protease [Alphaproteobacteria bacterium]
MDFNRLRELSQGSAVVISPSSLLTNCHVVKDRPIIAIVQEKEVKEARVAAADPSTDRCILAVDEANLVPVKGVRLFLGMKIGERVYTVGAPSGLELTLGEGIISGLRPSKTGRFVQTTAPISPGSSGGGLFDNSGNLIGVTTFLLKEAQALNFAIAAEDYWR